MEEDLRIFSRKNTQFHALIMAPNTNIIDDWRQRVKKSLPDLQEQIEICSFAYMMRNYQKYAQKKKYNYIVVDEAHHAVSPVLKTCYIQYFTPDFFDWSYSNRSTTRQKRSWRQYLVIIRQAYLWLMR